MRKSIIAVWGLAALAISWNLLTPAPSNETLCNLAPNARYSEAGRQLLPKIIDACTDIIESDGERGMELSLAYKLRGNAHYNNQEHDLAMRDYNKALELRPGYPHALIDRGHTYAAAGREAEALADYNRAIEGDPDPLMHLAHLGRAYIYWHMGELDAAISDFDEALHASPNYAQGYYHRGSVYFRKSDFQNAIADFERALAIDERLYKAYEGRAEADCALGRPQAYADDWADISQRFEGVRERVTGYLTKHGHLAVEADPSDDAAYLAGLLRLAEARCRRT